MLDNHKFRSFALGFVGSFMLDNNGLGSFALGNNGLGSFVLDNHGLGSFALGHNDLGLVGEQLLGDVGIPGWLLG